MRSRWSIIIGRELARVAALVVVVAVAATAIGECASGSAGERAARAAGVMPAEDAQVADADRARLARRVAREHGLDDALAVRLARAGLGAPVLDLGDSWVDRRPVRARLLEALPRTLALVFVALLVALAFGLGVAVAGARRPGGGVDTALAGLAAVAIALPPVWLGLVLMRTLAAGRPLAIAPIEGVSALPVLAMAVVPAFVLARHARAALAEAMARPWAVAERARGASELTVARHALRVQAGELLPLVVSLVAYLFGAAIVIEELFGIPGVGRALLHAAGRGDQPTIVGACVVLAACIGLASSTCDVLARAADPRRRDAP